ncbi:hypothetical protein BJX64DRAFT_292693 [Aspergillus heterothallicus]
MRLSHIFARKPQRRQPPKVPTDTVVPLHGWAPSYEVVMELAFKYDDVLDASALRNALERLLEINNWRELGGRLRYSGSARNRMYELHVPSHFSETRPGVIFRSSQWQGSITTHPVGSKLPNADNCCRPSFMGSPGTFASLMRRKTDPRQLTDWIYSDLPPLHVDVLNFHDASLVLVTYPHYLLDAMGYRTFLYAWTAVLHGRESEVPRLCSFGDHPYRQLSKKAPTDKYILHDAIQGKLARLRWIVRLLWERLWHSKQEQTMIAIPGWFVTALRKETLDKLALDDGTRNRAGQAPDRPPPAISESDALVAWFLKSYLAAAKPARNRPLVLMNVFDIRAIALDPALAYPMNTIVPSYTIIPISEVLANHSALLASRIRTSLEEQRTVDQVEAYLALQRKTEQETRSPPMIGAPDMFLTMCSNWNRARFFHFDLSPALLQQDVRESPRSDGWGLPSLFLNTTPLTSIGQSSGVILGRDANGTWWLEWFMGRTTRARLQKLFDSISPEPADCAPNSKSVSCSQVVVE